jgi:predicted transposase/invertase (TIGR01784 family)
MDYKEFLPVKSDIVFRLFFADERNEESLIGFLKAVLELPEDDYNEIEIVDPHLLREFDGDKLAVIDVKLKTKSRKVVHIEIQLKVTPLLKNRIILYDAKLITEQIGSGDDYDAIQKVISIVITDETLIPDSRKYHHRFTFYDPDAGVELSDIIEIHTLELEKLPENADGTELYDWAKFIAAETEEELNMIAERNPEVRRAVVKFRELSADERARDLYERREKARRDQASREKWARQQGEKAKALTIAKNLLKEQMPLDKIVDATGLSREEVENIRDSD